jgi:phage putative head morphogenesis protein, SPP1 gp7 family
MLEQKYRQSLSKIIKLINQSISGTETLQDINNVLYGIYQTDTYQELSDDMARKFVTLCNSTDAKTWREAARGGSINPEFIKHMTNNLYSNVGVIVDTKVWENAQLIKTLPLYVAENITHFVKTEAYKSIRASEISKELQGKVNGYSRARADTIARTESSKAMTALTEARSRDVGVNWYQWRTADDGLRVRNSHRHMEGVLVNWNNPPSPEALIGEKNVGHYNAGNIYNCRCYPSPLVTLNRVKWPAKVYYQGTIQVMSREEFERRM